MWTYLEIKGPVEGAHSKYSYETLYHECFQCDDPLGLYLTLEYFSKANFIQLLIVLNGITVIQSSIKMANLMVLGMVVLFRDGLRSSACDSAGLCLSRGWSKDFIIHIF